MAQAEPPAGSGAMGQQPTCEAGFLRSEKTGAQNTPLHIGRGLCPPLWPWAVDRENRGQYSLEHGAAVIPPCILGHGQGITPCQALNIEIRKSQEFTGVLLVLCFRRDLQDKQGTA